MHSVLALFQSMKLAANPQLLHSLILPALLWSKFYSFINVAVWRCTILINLWNPKNKFREVFLDIAEQKLNDCKRGWKSMSFMWDLIFSHSKEWTWFHFHSVNNLSRHRVLLALLASKLIKSAKLMQMSFNVWFHFSTHSHRNQWNNMFCWRWYDDEIRCSFFSWKELFSVKQSWELLMLSERISVTLCFH